MLNVYELIISQPEHFKQLRVKDLLFAHYHCPQTDDFMHIYTHYHLIVYTFSGERIIQRPERSVRLTEGKCAFIRKGAYGQQRREAAEWCVLVFFMPDSYLRQFISEYRLRLPVSSAQAPALQEGVLDVQANETTRSFFYSMIPYFTQSVPPSEELLELKFRELIFNILSNPENGRLLGYLCGLSDDDRPSIQEVMEANYMYHLTLEEYAKIAHRSLASFKREFGQLYHTSPGKWLLQKRLQHARMLLESTRKAISDIAWESGFENISHFSKTFKEQFGSSPANYKKKNPAYSGS
jgi:AraC-like DNA-binding protein